MPSLLVRERLGALSGAVDAATKDLTDRDAIERLSRADHTLWQEDPTEVADRVGWLPVVAEMQAVVAELDAFAEQAVADGFTDAVVLGMGGSSLFPEVLNRSFDAHRLRLRVLDTTDPAAIARVSRELDLATTLFVVASKSGSTIETRTQLEHFWEVTGGAGERFVVVTDPGSELGAWGREHGVRRVFENRSDIGGRYSALSYFGLVAGALLGVELAGLLAAAAAVDLDDGVRLAAILGAAAAVGRDKLTLVLPEGVASFGLWLEQLVAESTGKRGVGIVPVTGEPLGSPEVYGDDRLFVSLGPCIALDALVEAGHPAVELAFSEPVDLGAHVLLWEVAVALSGVLLGINPFDQPDVASAKEATARVLASGPVELEDVDPMLLLGQLRPGDYLVLQAFVDPGEEALLAALEEVRVAARDRWKVATTVGVGPRFLHSTGQLHKGGKPNGVFVQVVGDDPRDVPIPGRPYTFSQLKRAQADGDLLALLDRSLRAGRVSLPDLLAWEAST